MTAAAKARAYVLGLGIVFACAMASAQDVVVVAYGKTTVSYISAPQLRDIFTGVRSRFADGTRATPVMLKGGPVHEVFLAKHVGEASEDFRALWRKAVFTGQGSMPKEFDSEADLLHYVSVTPGAIGYVSRVRDGDAVKVLTVLP
jgi:ABC-type phosphate transport system substrate-binding protein